MGTFSLVHKSLVIISHSIISTQTKTSKPAQASLNFYIFIAISESYIALMGLATESKFHVLAVDDSIIDRKLIERLLKTSSFQGTSQMNC